MKPAPIHSLQQINSLDVASQRQWYTRLVPDPLLDMLGLTPDDLDSKRFTLTVPQDKGYVKLQLQADPSDRDAAYTIELADTPYGYTEVVFLNLLDPASPRFDIDRDEQGNDTMLGTVGRNLKAEQQAMTAGLAPGQLRRGLRMAEAVFAKVDQFCAALGHEMWVGQAFAYHNAIIFERHGFGYLQGRELMEEINSGFQKGGPLYLALDDSTPFRRPAQAGTAHGRSWAIHDGILGAKWGGVKQYRRIGEQAGVSTFAGPYLQEVGCEQTEK